MANPGAGPGALRIVIQADLQLNPNIGKDIQDALANYNITVPYELVYANAAQGGKFSADEVHEQDVARQQATEASRSTEYLSKALKVLNKDTSDLDDGRKEQVRLAEAVSSGFKKASTGIVSLFQQSFAIIGDIYGYMKRSSPFLQSIENLFNLAMQLFFMPLGNKLAEEMLPAVMEMIEAVLDIWDKMDGKSLGDMFSIAIAEGASMLGEYFSNIGQTLADQGGLIGSIGNILLSLGNFVENHAADLLTALLEGITFLLDNFKTFAALAAAFFTAHLASQIAIAATIASSNSWLGKVGIGVMGVASVAAAVGTYSALSEGGYVPAVNGGKLALIAEGGEGEYVVPESKVSDFVREHSTEVRPLSADTVQSTGAVSAATVDNRTYNITFSGLDTYELERRVKDIVNDQVSASRIMGGF